MWLALSRGCTAIETHTADYRAGRVTFIKWYELIWVAARALVADLKVFEGSVYVDKQCLWRPGVKPGSVEEGESVEAIMEFVRERTECGKTAANGYLKEDWEYDECLWHVNEELKLMMEDMRKGLVKRPLAARTLPVRTATSPR